jgi:hypothetical protein
MKKEADYLWTTGHGLYILLGLLLFGIFIAPWLIVNGLFSDLLIEVVFALILITGVFTIPCSSRTLRCGILLLGVLAVSTRVLDKYNQSNFTIVNLDNAVGILTLIVFSVLLTKHFFVGKASLSHRITAAIAVYLIFGVLFARLYEMAYLLNPSSFNLEHLHLFSFIYFSFITLTTMGYGDIVPVEVAARSLAMLEGITGQLYMVILISSLVSEFTALKMRSKEE